jgi:membrane protein DedA with SNARE-associated domain
METLFSSICDIAHDAHWIFFLLLMLAGLNLPISEDIILLTGGAIASTCIPDHTLRLYIWIYLGCWISAWEVYWIGRLLGPKLYQFKWIRTFITPERVDRLHHYYEKFGVFTFIFGRFIPGGMRNALFLSCGLGKMPFVKFILRDGFAALISTMTLFTIGYQFGKNYHTMIMYVKTYNMIAALIVIAALAIFTLLFWLNSRRKKRNGAK